MCGGTRRHLHNTDLIVSVNNTPGRYYSAAERRPPGKAGLLDTPACGVTARALAYSPCSAAIRRLTTLPEMVLMVVPVPGTV